MLLELKRELPKKSGAVLSRLYVDGVFFGYGLENKAYISPDGKYNLWARTSPSFGKNKVYIDVPGRTNIMFHGGNVPEHSGGCILIAANRLNESKIQGDRSDALYSVINDAWARGEKITFVVYKPFILLAAIAAAGGLYLLTKK